MRKVLQKYLEKPDEKLFGQLTTEEQRYAAKQAASGKRARDEKGRLKGDDESTPDVNEAYEDGKKPKRKLTGVK